MIDVFLMNIRVYTLSNIFGDRRGASVAFRVPAVQVAFRTARVAKAI